MREIKNINWNDIDIEKMFRINDYKTFTLPECNEAFKYVHSRLGHQIMQEVKKGNKETAVSYLAIVEKYHFDYEDYYLVRGIIRGDYKGYSISFNPEYQKVIPQSVWDKSLRFSGYEVPDTYCLKRKKEWMYSFTLKKKSRVAELVSPGDYETSLTTEYNVYHG